MPQACGRDVGLLGAAAVVPGAQGLTNAVEETRLRQPGGGDLPDGKHRVNTVIAIGYRAWTERTAIRPSSFCCTADAERDEEA
jgi:hypothetical protein